MYRLSTITRTNSALRRFALRRQRCSQKPERPPGFLAASVPAAVPRWGATLVATIFTQEHGREYRAGTHRLDSKQPPSANSSSTSFRRVFGCAGTCRARRGGQCKHRQLSAERCVVAQGRRSRRPRRDQPRASSSRSHPAFNATLLSASANARFSVSLRSASVITGTFGNPSSSAAR